MARGSDDVQIHSDGFREGRPAVNVKVYGTFESLLRLRVRERRDPRADAEPDLHQRVRGVGADEQADESVSNAELPVDLALARVCA